MPVSWPFGMKLQEQVIARGKLFLGICVGMQPGHTRLEPTLRGLGIAGDVKPISRPKEFSTPG
jgi:imidazoleglycerol phosphate synthase glutamine amidotransferase subunit HisH